MFLPEGKCHLFTVYKNLRPQVLKVIYETSNMHLEKLLLNWISIIKQGEIYETENTNILFGS